MEPSIGTRWQRCMCLVTTVALLAGKPRMETLDHASCLTWLTRFATRSLSLPIIGMSSTVKVVWVPGAHSSRFVRCGVTIVDRVTCFGYDRVRAPVCVGCVALAY
ncbi:hypothetical protein F5144DRAFT_584728 [Chaetomium tenue]|uniref:Uncharacterized protein n=1 Tax=Chaetomium tenue TaxID=1854479 RepID=A0ACB7P5I0_9PEZI|nr:hypothetical protein F5144DRAFT_584728 [Chaetomium globosum]